MYLENPKKKLYLYEETMHQALNILLSNKAIGTSMDPVETQF